MSQSLDASALDQLFRSARTHNAFTDQPVTEAELRALYALMKWGPTAANAAPARLVFVTSPEAKARLKPALAANNVDKTMAAPVTVIVGHDLDFHEQLPRLFPHADARAWFDGPQQGRVETALRNGSLQGAYLILAARALGLDAGPMSGFDNALVDAAFFAGTSIKSNFLVNLGHGDPAGVFPRLPRLSFDEAARIV
ncbi:malonic semialdehyde reductase [Pseudoxanthomonas spadix]|jgi:3-hydroxypropanoate dehydrogenase|uniref:Putative NADH dehydrogenase/NAD(P)H nitroreductase DSC_03370 n=1 Tax=Pseudoxanthomonas spadix (strain BD-a59) TaxID=1045855 RepID=G7UN16_PSEUP|nr:malonic semialdehyde reductase [Pseudoxanthomonas spadix]AER55327.1 malonic semialdehyde reductase [Pseudoxanthomonas spadix BD-a59]MBP3975723.1 malonic semialdehyde reductase [Pseudoxanthomonas spadix]RMW95257.1 malonic semialdehyde reductase [Pseudoxanthomonas spadix]